MGAFEEGSPRPWLFSRDELKDDEQINEVNGDLRALVLGAHCMVPYNNPTFADYGHTMYSLAENTSKYNYLSKFIPSSFENRGIDIFMGHNNFSICDKTQSQLMVVEVQKIIIYVGPLRVLKNEQQAETLKACKLFFKQVKILKRTQYFFEFFF